MSEGILDSIKNVMPSKKAYSRLICTNPEYDIGATKQRQRAKRQNYAKSKAGTWGPTHSEDSEDNEDSSVGPRTPEAASPPVESSTPANRQKRASTDEKVLQRTRHFFLTFLEVPRHFFPATLDDLEFKHACHLLV